MTAEEGSTGTHCLSVLILDLNLRQKEKCVMRPNLDEVNGVFPSEGYANLSVGWRCWSKPDWRKPSFSSGYALVKILDFS